MAIVSDYQICRAAVYRQAPAASARRCTPEVMRRVLAATPLVVLANLKRTFQSNAHDNIFAIGDAGNLPTSKTGSVAHFAIEVFAQNFMRHIPGRSTSSRGLNGLGR
jgi:hypothetical protein